MANKKRKCSQGFSCGRTCISRSIRCRSNLSKQGKKVVENYSQFIERVNREVIFNEIKFDRENDGMPDNVSLNAEGLKALSKVGPTAMPPVPEDIPFKTLVVRKSGNKSYVVAHTGIRNEEQMAELKKTLKNQGHKVKAFNNNSDLYVERIPNEILTQRRAEKAKILSNIDFMA